MKDVLYTAPDSDLLEAARYAAESLRNWLEMLEILEAPGARRPAGGWEHYVDSVGGVVSERRQR